MQKLNCRDTKGTPKVVRKQWRKAAFRTTNLTTFESKIVETRRVFQWILDSLLVSINLKAHHSGTRSSLTHVEYSRQDQCFLNMFLIAFMVLIVLIAYILMSFYNQSRGWSTSRFLVSCFLSLHDCEKCDNMNEWKENLKTHARAAQLTLC